MARSSCRRSAAQQCAAFRDLIQAALALIQASFRAGRGGARRNANSPLAKASDLRFLRRPPEMARCVKACETRSRARAAPLKGPLWRRGMALDEANERYGPDGAGRQTGSLRPAERT